jgi:hypothetical protein
LKFNILDQAMYSQNGANPNYKFRELESNPKNPWVSNARLQTQLGKAFARRSNDKLIMYDAKANRDASANVSRTGFAETGGLSYLVSTDLNMNKRKAFQDLSSAMRTRAAVEDMYARDVSVIGHDWFVVNETEALAKEYDATEGAHPNTEELKMERAKMVSE